MNTPLYGDNFEINGEILDNEETDDTEPRVRLPEHNVAVNAVARIMEGYGTDIPEHLLSEFINMKIETRDLSALTDKDLQLFGFDDELLRATMVQEFAMLPNQKEHIGSEPPADTREYNLMLWNVADHLENMRNALGSIIVKTNNLTEDILIDESTYSSSIALRTIDEMSKTVIRLDEKLLQFAGQNEKEPTRNFSLWKNLFLFGALSAGSAFIIKYAYKSNCWGR